jgi:hypothetical protein
MKLLFVLLLSQLLAPKTTVQHVTAEATVVKAPDGSVTLALDVTPNPGIHVYAAGAKDFTPVSLVLTPHDAVTPGKATYPRADPVPVAGGDPAPAYRKAFRISQPVTVKNTKGGLVEVDAVLKYQACDDRVCYPVAMLPVNWTLGK